MRLSTITNFGASLMSLATSAAAFDAAGSNNVVLYWGQASAGSQEPLGTYCESNAADVYVVSFLNSFNGNGDLTLTISGCNDNFAGGLANCPAIAADIKKCQSLGKKVFISLGGAVGSYGFTSDAGGANFADTLWNTFGGGTAAERPFGDAIVDGYDLDIENQQQMGYVALVKRLREHFASSSGKYYISATPQCPYPDASVGEALAGADIDFAYVQFYNNYCGVNNPGQFNFDTWDNFAKTVSPNKNIKIYLGVPAAVSAASTGYIDGATLKSYVDKVKQYSSFGGIMMWDASQAFINKEGGVTYAEIAKNALGGGGAPAPVVSVASTPVATTPAAASSAAWAPASSAAWAPASSAAASSPVWVAPSAPAASSPVWIAPSSANNGQWKPEVSSVGSLAAPSAPIFAAQSGNVESDSTVTEEHTVTSVGETVTSTVPREGEAAAPVTSSIPAASSAAASAPAESPASVPASSKAKHTVYATTIESVYIDTTVVNVPGPSPTAEISSVHSLAAPSGPAFAAESGEVKVKNETAPESVSASAASSVELTTTTTSSVFTTQTVTGTTVVVSSAASSAASSEAVAEAKPESSVESSAPASSAAASSVESSAVVSAEGAAATTSAAAATSSAATSAPLTSLSTVAPSDLLKTATATSVTISLADSAPQKTISPESAHPPCDGKQGNDLAKCLNGIYGNQEVISKLSVQDKQKPVQTDAPVADAPAASSAAAASSTEAPAAASSEAPAASSAASSAAASSTEAAAAKPTESAAKPDSKDTSKDTPSTSAPLADSGCTEGEVGCSPSGEFIMCNFNKWVHFACPPTTTCFAVASGKNAVVGCNFIDAPIPLLKRDESLPRPPPTLQQRRQNNVDVFAMLK